MKRLKDNSDAPEARHGTLPNTLSSSKKKDMATFYSLRGRMGPPGCGTKEPDERKFVVDSGASMHMVSKKDLNPAELETMRTSRSPTAVMTANGEVQTRQEATVYVKELDLFVTVMLLEETPAASSLGKLCEDHGYTEPAVKNHISPKMSRESIAVDQTVPFVVRGLSTSSSTTPTPTSSSSSSQDSVFDVKRYAENPVPERSGSTSEGLRL